METTIQPRGVFDFIYKMSAHKDMKLIDRLATELSIEEHIPSPEEATSTFLNYWYDIFFL